MPGLGLGSGTRVEEPCTGIRSRRGTIATGRGMSSGPKRAGLGQRDYIALAPYQLRPHRSPVEAGALSWWRVANGPMRLSP